MAKTHIWLYLIDLRPFETLFCLEWLVGWVNLWAKFPVFLNFSMLTTHLDCSSAALATPQKFLSNWKLVQLRMLDFRDRRRVGISRWQLAIQLWARFIEWLLTMQCDTIMLDIRHSQTVNLPFSRHNHIHLAIRDCFQGSLTHMTFVSGQELFFSFFCLSSSYYYSRTF